MASEAQFCLQASSLAGGVWTHEGWSGHGRPGGVCEQYGRVGAVAEGPSVAGICRVPRTLVSIQVILSLAWAPGSVSPSALGLGRPALLTTRTPVGSSGSLGGPPRGFV